MFAPEVAEKVKRTLSERFNGRCPCDEDQPCPLLPDDVTNLRPCVNKSDPFPRGVAVPGERPSVTD